MEIQLFWDCLDPWDSPDSVEMDESMMRLCRIGSGGDVIVNMAPQLRKKTKPRTAEGEVLHIPTYVGEHVNGQHRHDSPSSIGEAIYRPAGPRVMRSASLKSPLSRTDVPTSFPASSAHAHGDRRRLARRSRPGSAAARCRPAWRSLQADDSSAPQRADHGCRLRAQSVRLQLGQADTIR